MLRIYRHYAHDCDVSYGEHGAKNLLDIWRRPDLDPAGHAPVLLQVPGGAWASGNKRGQAHPLMSHLAELGWVCVSMNYRLSPRATWPDHIVDVNAQSPGSKCTSPNMAETLISWPSPAVQPEGTYPRWRH